MPHLDLRLASQGPCTSDEKPYSRSEAAAATEEGAAYDFEAVGYAFSFHYVLRGS